MNADPPDIASGGVSIQAGGDVRISGDVVGGDKIVIHHPPPLTAREQEDRRGLRLLRQAVRRFWVDGVLADSMHHAAWLALGKELRPEAVQHPWEAVLEQPGTPHQIVPGDTDLSALFDQAGRALLILGEPGSGKTTTLLELTRDLLARAEQDDDFNDPIPVVFNLASWTERDSLVDWLTAELAAKYHVPQRIGRPWLLGHRVLPLLDGLDEVRGDDRLACIRAINRYAETVGFAGLVASCRLAEYTELGERLRLNAAIMLQPLSTDQIEAYLTRVGAEAQALRAQLHIDPALLKLAESPLTLNLLTLVAEDSAAVSASTDTLEGRRRRIFDAYVARMSRRRGSSARPFSPDETRRWLTDLARTMQRLGQSIFLVEQLEPVWLERGIERIVYVLTTRLITAGLVSGVLLTATNLALTDSADAGRTFGLVGPLTLATGLLAGLLLALTDFWPIARQAQAPPASLLRRLVAIGWLAGIFAILFGGHGLALGLLTPPPLPATDVAFPPELVPALNLLRAVFLAFAFGLVGGGAFGVLFGSRRARLSAATDVRIAEALTWVWGRFMLGAAIGLGVGVLASLLLALLVVPLAFLAVLPPQISADVWAIASALGATLVATTVMFGLVVGPLFGALGAVGGGLFAGLRRRVVARGDQSNLGLRLLARNAGLAALCFVGIGTLPFGVAVVLNNVFSAGVLAAAEAMSAGLADQTLTRGVQVALELWRSLPPFEILTSGLTLSLPIALLAAFWYGGLDVVHHLCLRVLIWSTGRAPLRYEAFLEHAVERVYLRRVGGGFMFIHRLLLEYFAHGDE